MKRLLLATVLLTLLGAAPAAACTGGSRGDVRQRLAAADAAFVGSLAARRSGALVFRVAIRVTGPLGRRVRVHWVKGCGAPPRKGRRVGLLLHRSHGRWVASGADVVAPGELQKIVGIGP